MYVVYKPKGDLILLSSQTRSRYLGLGTPCSSCNSVMRSPLKEKIYNAISRAIHDTSHPNDCNNPGDGALIVGGRRRNRKKRNKKNGQKKKKTGSLESLKTRLSPKGCRKGDVQQDSCPLITETEDSREEHRDVCDFGDQTPGDEQPGHDGVLAEDEQPGHDGDEQRVSAEGGTGRAASGSAQDAGEGEGEGEGGDEEHGLIETERLEQDRAALVCETGDSVRLELTTSSSFIRHNPDSPSPLSSSPQSPWLYTESKVIQVTHLQPPAQLDDVDLKVDADQTVVKDAADHDGSQVCLQPMQVEDTSAPKSEASPLIDKDEGKGDKSSSKGKDSKFKDQQPGLPCCTIL